MQLKIGNKLKVSLKEHLAQIEHNICLYNTCQHVFKEKISFSLELHNYRNTHIAQACYEEIVKYIKHTIFFLKKKIKKLVPVCV
jgi:hypothetical protein